MKVKNTGKKVIGFGSLVLPPDAVAELPAGYDPSHPTVRFYIDKGWLAPCGEAVPVDPADAKVDLPDVAGDSANATALTGEEKEAAQKKANVEEKIKSLSQLNLEQLRGEAFALGVDCVETDTKKAIAQKIAEKLKADLG